MSKGLSDPDAIAFHMKKESSICCRSKKTPTKHIAFDDEDELWSRENRSSDRIKKKAEVVDNESARRKVRKSRTYEPSVTAKKYKV